MENIIPHVGQASPTLTQKFNKEAIANIWVALFRWTLIGGAILIPIAFLPLTSSPVSLNKQVLLIAATLVTLLAWAGLAISEGRIVITKSWFLWASLALMLFLGINVLLAKSPLDAFRIDALPLSFTVLGATLIFGQLIAQLARSHRDGLLLSLGIFFSISFLSLVGFLQLFGAAVFPFDFTKAKSFTPIGSMYNLAIVAGVGLIFGIALLLMGRNFNKYLFWAIAVGSFFDFIMLFLLNFQTAWITSGIGLLLMLASLIGRKGMEGLRLMTLPIVLLTVAVLFSIFRSPISLFSLDLPVEITPNWQVSVDIAKNTIKESPFRAFFGAGPGNFPYQWNLYKPLDINTTNFWGVRFPSAVSALTTFIAEEGILGTLLLLAVFASIGLLALSALQRSLSEETSPVLKAILIGGVSAMASLLAAFVLYPASLAQNLYFFSLAGLITGTLTGGKHEASYEIQLTESNAKTILIALTLILLMIIAITTLYFEGERYAGAVTFANGVKVWNQQGKFDEATQLMTRSLTYDRQEDSYARSLAQLYIQKITDIVQKPVPNQQALQSLQNELQFTIANAVQIAQELKNRNPIDSVNWSLRGNIYENVIPLVSGADGPALDAYREATKHDPKNPAHFLDSGRTHFVIAEAIARNVQILQAQRQGTPQQLQQFVDQAKKELGLAIEDLTKAVELKSDLAAAHFLLAQVYDRRGEIDKAIASTEKVAQVVPQDIGVRFQLGFLYYKVNNLPKAQQQFEAAVALSDNYSNARYFLGLIYDHDGQKDKAIEQFQKIAALNPDNREVKIILANLQTGKPALASIVPPAEDPAKRKDVPISEKSDSAVKGK